eukprot:GHRQ01020679.1.p1 GENE.GHRQ01020679.1~~GHRQ01020679.1.p1  ORF type:complete len:264 (+),score=78.75 GHRQ01020679.1:899-1690(+)
MQTGALKRQGCLQGSSCSKQPYTGKLPMLQRSTMLDRADQLSQPQTSLISAHSRLCAVRDSRPLRIRCPHEPGTPSQEQQPLHIVLTSMAAAAAVTLSSLLGPELTLLGPGAAAAKSRMTPDEQVTIDIFKRSTPSVVNVTNLTARRDAFTMNMLEIPQGAGSGFIWDDAGHVITNYHVITDASDIQVTLMGGAEYSAKVIGVDQDKDVAVLQVRRSTAGRSCILAVLLRSCILADLLRWLPGSQQAAVVLTHMFAAAYCNLC